MCQLNQLTSPPSKMSFEDIPTESSLVASLCLNAAERLRPIDDWRNNTHSAQGWDESESHLRVSSFPSNRSSPVSTGSYGGDKKRQEKIFVQHQYRDYSNHPIVGDGLVSMSCVNTSSFPVKLYCVLQDAEIEGFTNIISWQPHGRAFRIHQPQIFANKILPRYFGDIKISSFLRQVNIYGFLRLYQKTNDHNAYYQDLFLRGRIDLVIRIRRQGVKGYGIRRSACPDQEPNLYAMPYVQEPSQSFWQSAVTLESAVPENNQLQQYNQVQQWPEVDLEPLPVNDPSVATIPEIAAFLKNFDFDDVPRHTFVRKRQVPHMFHSTAA